MRAPKIRAPEKTAIDALTVVLRTNVTLRVLDISANAITAAAIPPALFANTCLARLWREGCPMMDSELAAMDGWVRPSPILAAVGWLYCLCASFVATMS